MKAFMREIDKNTVEVEVKCITSGLYHTAKIKKSVLKKELLTDRQLTFKEGQVKTVDDGVQYCSKNWREKPQYESHLETIYNEQKGKPKKSDESKGYYGGMPIKYWMGR